MMVQMFDLPLGPKMRLRNSSARALAERQLKAAGKPTEREANLQALTRRRREHEKSVEEQREVMEA